MDVKERQMGREILRFVFDITIKPERSSSSSVSRASTQNSLVDSLPTLPFDVPLTMTLILRSNFTVLVCSHLFPLLHRPGISALFVTV